MAKSTKARAISKSKSTPKTPASAAKKPAPRSSKTPASRTRAKLADSPQSYVVFGTVTYADGKPAAGLTVIAYDKDDSGADTLGQPAVTTESGNFSISYSEADFRKTNKELGGADVVVCVYDANRELLFTCKKKSNGPAEFELKITVPVAQYVVHGTVTDANQKPLMNMFVCTYGCGSVRARVNGARPDIRALYRMQRLAQCSPTIRHRRWCVLAFDKETD